MWHDEGAQNASKRRDRHGYSCRSYKGHASTISSIQTPRQRTSHRQEGRDRHVRVHGALSGDRFSYSAHGSIVLAVGRCQTLGAEKNEEHWVRLSRAAETSRDRVYIPVPRQAIKNVIDFRSRVLRTMRPHRFHVAFTVSHSLSRTTRQREAAGSRIIPYHATLPRV